MDQHQRTVIRKAVVETLRNRTSAGARVQGTRIDDYRKHELPAISVYTPGDEGDADSVTSTREITRDLRVEVAGFVSIAQRRSEDDVMDIMDALAKEIERVLSHDPFLGGAAADSVYESTETSIQQKADPPVGIVTLTYAVTFRSSPEPPGNLDDFLRADVTTRIVGASDDNAAHDEIVVRPQETP